MRQGIIVLGVYPCFTSGKDNEKLNTYQIFPDYFIKTLLWGLTPAVSFQKILYLGAWPQHLVLGPDPRGKFTTHERYQKQAAVHGRPRYAMRPKALEFHTGLLLGKPVISRFLRNYSHPSPLRHYVPAHRHPYLVARPLVAHSSLRVLRIHHRIPSPGSLRYR